MKEDLQQMIIGSLLGDGCIPKKGASKYHRYSEAHSAKQKEYIKHKHERFKKHNLVGKLSYNKIKNQRYKKGYFEEYRFKTKGDSIFDFYRNLFYPKGVKIVPENISELLQPEALAYWYMDDGYKTGRLLKGRALSAECFLDKDRKLLLNTLKNKFNLVCSIHKSGVIYV